MKKILLAIGLLVLVVLGVWAFRAARQAFVTPIELVEGDSAGCHVVFAAETKAGEKEAGDQQDVLRKTLEAAGIKPETGVAMWVKDGGTTIRTGLMVRAEDFRKARSLRGGTLAVAIPAQRGWVPAGEASAGRVGAVMAAGRFPMAAMEKARTLGLVSYCLLIRMDGGPAKPALVRAPK